MTDRAPTPADARDLLAAEYVLGLTESADLPRVETLIMRDSGFAASVAAWRARLAPLDLTAAPQTTPDSLWAGVEAAIEQLSAAPQDPIAEAALAPHPAAAEPRMAPVEPRTIPDIAAQPARPIPRPMRTPEREPLFVRIWASLAFWRFAGLSGALAAAVLAVGAAYFYREANQRPAVIAVLLAPDSNQPTALVHAFADGRADVTPLVQFDIPPGKAIELWTLWDKAVGPKSIAVFDRTGRLTLKLQGLPKPQPGQIFEMTLESAGGSPSGKPTGPIVNKGEATTAL